MTIASRLFCNTLKASINETDRVDSPRHSTCAIILANSALTLARLLDVVQRLEFWRLQRSQRPITCRAGLIIFRTTPVSSFLIILPLLDFFHIIYFKITTLQVRPCKSIYFRKPLACRGLCRVKRGHGLLP